MSNTRPLVSIIMPAYNAGETIAQSIDSVLAQTYSNWELLIVDDGSVDNTATLINSYSDKRIRYFAKKNGGVSSARNMAFENMRGDFFCFLDADDLLTPESVSVRIDRFEQEQEIGILDGTVIVTKNDIKNVLRIYRPSLSGRVVKKFALLSDKVFCMPSAMIRVEPAIVYRFDEQMTHAEDVLFYLKVHQQSKLLYASVPDPILYYRRGNKTAMADLDGLGKGYVQFYRHVKATKILDTLGLVYLKYKIGRIMFLSYLRKGKLYRGINYLNLLFTQDITAKKQASDVNALDCM